MNWFEAFQMVNAELMATDDEELIDAWCIFLRSPFPHLANPPAAEGVPAGRVLGFAEKFLETAEQWQGRGKELLIFRLVQAVEALVDVVGGERPLAATSVAAADVLALVSEEDVPWVTVDEAHQVSYCDECGFPLFTDGHCMNCDGGKS